MSEETPVETTEDEITTEETAQVEESSEATAEESEDSSAEPKKAKGVQKRIDELTHNWRSTERDRDYWRELALKNQQPQQQPQQLPEESPPKEEDFEDYNDYLKAEARYVVKEELKAEREAIRQESESTERQKEGARIQADFMSRADAARGRYGDFDAVAFNPAIPISEGMMEVILRSDRGPDMAYYLGKNPDVAQKISAMTPYMAASEMGKLETSLSAQKKETKAPDPVEPIGSGTSKSKELDEIQDINEWAALRRKQKYG